MLASERLDLYTCRNERHERGDPQPARAVGARGGARREPRRHPARPRRGCRRSSAAARRWFMAQAYAALREGSGHGRTDAFAASEMPSRPYDVVVALSRSGTTTEVAHALMRSARSRTVAITAVPDSPVAARRRRGRRARVRRRAVGRADALRDHRAQPAARPRGPRRRRRRSPTPRAALDAPLPVEPGEADRWAFLGRGWTVGLASEAALKLRESAQAWTEAYPAFEYRHGPISIAGPGAVGVVRSAPADERARERPRGRRARRRARPRPARLARARPADRGRARRGRRARPRPPAQPDPLGRPTITEVPQ